MLPKRFSAEANEKTVTDASKIHDIIQSDEFRPTYREVSTSDLDFCDEGYLYVAGEKVPYVQGVHEDLAKVTGIPLSFGRKIPFELFRYNFNALKTRSAKGISLCFVRDTVVGFAKAPYNVARTIDVLDRVDLSVGNWAIDQATISDFGSRINLLLPDVTVEPEVGDVIRVGMQVANSETGGDSLRASVFTLRLACSNGSILKSNEHVIYWQSLQNRTYDASLKAFVTKLEQAKSSAEALVRATYDEVLERPLSDVDFVSLFRSLKRRVASGPRAEAILDVSAEERRDIEGAVRRRKKHAPPQPTRLRTFDVHNRITAAARGERLLMRQSLEELGGTLLFTAA